jgi:hypothetical protein
MFYLTELTVIERLAVLEKRMREIGDLFEAEAIAEDLNKIIEEVTPPRKLFRRVDDDYQFDDEFF